MIKGCQKRIIHITNTGSPYFEEAYFILKNDEDGCCGKTDDMVREALRIARNTSEDKKTESKKLVKGAAAALLAVSLASLIFGTVMLIIVLAA